MTKAHTKVIDIGASDENADWIKSLPGHEGEHELHDDLAQQFRENRERWMRTHPHLFKTDEEQVTPV